MVKHINEKDDKNRRSMKYLIEYGEGIVTYGNLSRIYEEQDAVEPTDEDRPFIFKKILCHHGPCMPNEPEYCGSNWNLIIK